LQGRFHVLPPTDTDLQRLRERLVNLAVPDPAMVVVDDIGLIAHVDAPLARCLGWEPDELVGQPLTTIIPARVRDAHHLGFSRFLTTGRPTLLERPLHLSVLHRDGGERGAEHVIIAMERSGRWLFAAAIRVEAR
jgi:PAS domain S-box-containing protein